MAVSCECCVLSGKGLCVGLITRPEESYRLWRVVVCDREAPMMKRPWPTGGCCAIEKNLQIISTVILEIIIIYLVFQRSTKLDTELVIR
jgi:hypothetical protein